MITAPAAIRTERKTMDLQFRKSSYCTLRECVEVASINGGVAIRHSKLTENRLMLVFSHNDWHNFLQVVKFGSLDFALMTSPFRAISLTPHMLLLGCFHRGSRTIALQDTRAEHAKLLFTKRQWDTFLAGVRANEFDVEALARTRG